jgi:hypothetical protein
MTQEGRAISAAGHVLARQPREPQPPGNRLLSPRSRRGRGGRPGRTPKPWTVQDAIRVVRALGRNAARTETELIELKTLRLEVDAAVDRAVQATVDDGYSWGDVGRLFGMTRQGARQRWAHDDRELSRDGGGAAGV